MPYQVSYQQENGYLSVVVHGERTFEMAIPLVLEIYQRALAENIYRLLVDIRDLQGRLEIMEGYDIVTSEFPKLRGSGFSKIAILDRESNEENGLTFFETLAKNRGFPVSVFTDRENAVAWLLENLDEVTK